MTCTVCATRKIAYDALRGDTLMNEADIRDDRPQSAAARRFHALSPNEIAKFEVVPARRTSPRTSSRARRGLFGRVADTLPISRHAPLRDRRALHAIMRATQEMSARVDAGPWLCVEQGCPAPTISCAMLAHNHACDRTFGDIWRWPLIEVQTQRAETLANAAA